MSFVGPRPALFNQHDLIEARTAAGVDELIPGLTGWAQVNGRDDLPIPRKVELDREYLLRRSFALDLRILWLTAINVRYRDVKYAVPFVIQLWFFCTPVFYSSLALIPEKWRFVYGLNPMAGVVEGFRWALLGLDPKPGAEIFVSLAAIIVLLVAGVLYFQRVERRFADVI